MGIGSAVGQASTPSSAQAPQPSAPQSVGGKGAINQAVQPAPTSAPPTAPTSAPQPVGGKGIQQAVQPGQSNFMAPPPGASDATTLKIPSAYSPQVTPMQPGMPPSQMAQMSSRLQPGVPFGMQPGATSPGVMPPQPVNANYNLQPSLTPEQLAAQNQLRTEMQAFTNKNFPQLQTLQNQMQGMDQRSPEYQQAMNQFDQLSMQNRQMLDQQFGSRMNAMDQLQRGLTQQQIAMNNQAAAFDPQNPQLSAIQRSMLGTQPVPQVLPARPPMQQPGPFAGPRPMFQQYLQGQGGLRALMERLRGGYGGMQQSPSQTFQDRYK